MRAFSLLEVVIAAGIFAAAVVALLALMPAALRQSADLQDTRGALGLTGAVEAALVREAQADGLDALATRIPALAAATTAPFALVADRDGGRVRRSDPAEYPAQDQYYLIEVRRHDSGRLAYIAGGTVLALSVRVSWPYRPLTSAGLADPVAEAVRQSVEFSVALNR